MRHSALKNYPVYEPVIEKDGEGVTTEKWTKRKSMLLEIWPWVSLFSYILLL